MSNVFSIAIDGPVASGKGTLAPVLARKLNGYFINTGSMYRAVALYCIDKKINIQSEQDVALELSKIHIDLNGDKVFLNSHDVTHRIKEIQVEGLSSIVAGYRAVRRDLITKQRFMAENALRKGRIVIAEGRDIATKVLPDALIKIFLTASLEIRAKRRFEQYIQNGVLDKKLDEVLEEVKERDLRDTTRAIDPLPINPQEHGYWVLDNTNQSEEETINIILQELKNKGVLVND